MKKRVLLVDESLTVQKVVALTLDRHRFAILYAKSRSEAMKQITESPPDLILVSDHVTDITTSSFPKEVEAWMGRDQGLPPVVLITGQDIKEQRHYTAVLKKPFSPQALQTLVNKLTQDEPMRPMSEATVTNHSIKPQSQPAQSQQASSDGGEEFEDNRFQQIFNNAFADEAQMTRETLRNEIDEEEKTLIGIQVRQPGKPTSAVEEADDPMWDTPVAPSPRQGRGNQAPANASELWNQGVAAQTKAATSSPASALLGAEDSMAYKAVLENKVTDRIEGQDLDAMVDKILNRIVPPIVERLVQERLDKLLKEHEQFVELKQ